MSGGGESERPPRLRRTFHFPALGRRQRMRGDVDDELRFHLDERVDELVAAGMTRAAAEVEARRRFGDVDRIGAECETIDAGTARRRRDRDRLASLGRDVRYALRGMAARPGFTAVVVATLALGIGANTAIFSVVDRVLRRPVAAPALDRLVVVRDDLPGIGLRATEVSPGEAEDILARTDLFETSAAYRPYDLTLTGTGEPRQLHLVATMGRFFDVFGARPLLGRLYGPGDVGEGRPRVVVLSHHAWQELSGGDSAAVGRTLLIEGEPHEVIGVMPPDFRFPRSADVWSPLVVSARMRSAEQRMSLSTTVVARLRPGVTTTQLAGQLRAEAERWHERYRAQAYAANLQHTLVALPFVPWLAGQLRVVLLVLTGAVALVLLIACANVASLELVRAIGRGREMAVRAAMGAGRWTIARQLVVESVLLAMAGGVAGLLLGAALLRIVARSSTATQYRVLQDVRLDGGVLAFTGLVALACAVLFGTAPALRAVRLNVNEALKASGGGGGSGGSAGRGRNRALQGAVVAQIALTLMLLVGAGLLTRSLSRLIDVDPGFRPERVLTFRVSASSARYASGARRVAFFDALRERLRTIPGVQAAGIVAALPLDGGGDSSPFEIVGVPPAAGEPERHANLVVASGDYFRAMGIPLRRGRTFAESDRDGAPLVAVIDERLAEQYFRGRDPIGAQISQGMPATIVGVVGAVHDARLETAPKATVYYPYGQRPWLGSYAVAVRSALPPSSLTGAVRAAVASLDRDLPVTDVAEMPQVVRRSLATQRLATVVLGGFAALSLVLALLGVYGVLSYSMSRRTQEIGIRLALGAQPADVLRLALGSALSLAATGLAIGGLLFLGLGSALRSLLYGVGPRDPATLAAAAALLAAVAAAAAYVPARRAARTDPTVALRAE